MNNYVECIRKGKNKPFRLKREVCIAIQSNPDKKCPTSCKEKEVKNENCSI